MPLIEIARSGEPTQVSVSWVDEIHKHLIESGADNIFPKHFLSSTFPRIGGIVLAFSREGKIAAYGFAFPTADVAGEKIRGHWLIPDHEGISLPENWYDAHELGHQYFPEELVNENISLTKEFPSQSSYQAPFSIYRPNHQMACTAQELQNKKWQPDNRGALYPADLYNPSANSATRLVIIDKNKNVTGFLFGFYGRGNKWMGNKNGHTEYGTWIESQLMAVADEAEGYGLGASLKWQQLKEAKEQGIKLVHWTYDPLLAGNAKLNLNTLGGIVAEFTPKYYPFFRNARNRVPASRFGVFWLVDSKRAQVAKHKELTKLTFEELVSRGYTDVISPLSDDIDQKLIQLKNQPPETILIQIPENWQTLQDEALKTNDNTRIELWRNKSDKLFEQIIGRGDGKYVITSVVFDKKQIPFLVAVPFSLLEY